MSQTDNRCKHLSERDYFDTDYDLHYDPAMTHYCAYYRVPIIPAERCTASCPGYTTVSLTPIRVNAQETTAGRPRSSGITHAQVRGEVDRLVKTIDQRISNPQLERSLEQQENDIEDNDEDTTELREAIIATTSQIHSCAQAESELLSRSAFFGLFVLYPEAKDKYRKKFESELDEWCQFCEQLNEQMQLGSSISYDLDEVKKQLSKYKGDLEARSRELYIELETRETRQKAKQLQREREGQRTEYIAKFVPLLQSIRTMLLQRVEEILKGSDDPLTVDQHEDIKRFLQEAKHSTDFQVSISELERTVSSLGRM